MFKIVWGKMTAHSSNQHAGMARAVEAGERAFIRCIVLALLMTTSTTLRADDAGKNEQIPFDIPQQRADLALTQFAEQADLTLIFPFDEVRERTANRLVGEYPVEKAVAMLLAGTGLTPTFSKLGRVLVGVHQSATGGTADNSPDILASSSVTVAAGEQLILGTPEADITEVSPEEIEVKLSWRQGNLIFRGESLEDAVAEIGRYTTVEFVILDDDLRKVRIAGLFRAGDVDGLLATLRENFNISYQRTGDGKILLTSL